MSYRAKQILIINALKATGYKMFDGDSADAMDFLERNLTSFPDYANVVIREQIMHPIWRVRYDGQELRDRIQDLDHTRRIKHDAAIASVNVLNRFSKNLGLEPFADIDTSDRHAVAAFIGSYVNEMYNNGIGSPDDAYLNKDQEYDTKKTGEILREDAMQP